jgi:hypothetical protein
MHSKELGVRKRYPAKITSNFSSIQNEARTWPGPPLAIIIFPNRPRPRAILRPDG